MSVPCNSLRLTDVLPGDGGDTMFELVAKTIPPWTCLPGREAVRLRRACIQSSQETTVKQHFLDTTTHNTAQGTWTCSGHFVQLACCLLHADLFPATFTCAYLQQGQDNEETASVLVPATKVRNISMSMTQAWCHAGSFTVSENKNSNDL